MPPEVRQAPPLSPARMRRLAEHYVERFGGPSANLRRMLKRHIDRSAREHGTDSRSLIQQGEAIIAELCEAGAINDAAYAQGKARSLRERGTPARMIAMKLRLRGLDPQHVQRAMDELASDPADSELAAAKALVRRRRLGPHRPADKREAYRQKDLAAVVRAGFGFDVARRALAGLDPD